MLNTIPLLARVGSLAAVMAGVSGSALASPTYEFRHPMVINVTSAEPAENETGSPDVSVPTAFTLTASALPAATVGQYYDFDFNAMLSIEGDDPLSRESVAWSLQGLEGYPEAEGPRINALGVPPPPKRPVVRLSATPTRADWMEPLAL